MAGHSVRRCVQPAELPISGNVSHKRRDRVYITWAMWRPPISVFLVGCLPSTSPVPTGGGGDDSGVVLPGDSGDSAESVPTTPTGDPSLMCSVALSCEGNILDEPKAPCDIEIVSGDGIALYNGRAGVELRGRSSLTFPKPQYGIELREHTELPIWPGSKWRYLDDGTDPGPDWMQPGFDDSAWTEGPAPLGYGVDWLSTVVQGSESGRTHPTTYYRRTFTPAVPTAITQLELGIIRNDAAAAYLNGTEVVRENLSANAGYSTYANESIPTADEVLWLQTEVPSTLLVAGTNVIGVEVHQAEGDNADSRFDLYLDAAGDNAGVDMFNMGADSDWILDGMYVDRALFRNRLAFDLFQSFGEEDRYAPEGVFCELTLGGEYQGIYALGEKIKRSSSRLDLSDEGALGSSFIIKLDDTAGFHSNAMGTGSWQLVYPEPGAESEAAVSEFLSNWERSVLGENPGDPETGMFSYADAASTIDWVLLQEFTKNVDAYALSVYMWRNDAGKAFFAPWDFDLSMGYPYYDCGATGWIFRSELVNIIAADPTFRTAIAARWADLRQGPLSEDAILARIAGYDATLAPALDRNAERWPIADVAFSTDELEDWLCPIATYDEEHVRTLEFIRERLAWIDSAIAEY